MEQDKPEFQGKPEFPPEESEHGSDSEMSWPMMFLAAFGFFFVLGFLFSFMERSEGANPWLMGLGMGVIVVLIMGLLGVVGLVVKRFRGG